MHIRTLFAGFLAATLMVGLPSIQSALAGDAPAKAQKAKKAKKKDQKAAKPAAPAAAAAPAPAPAAAAAGTSAGAAVAGAAAVGAVAGSAASAAAGDDQKAALDKVIADADAARKKAASVRGEWRDTAKMIKQAQEAGAAGDYAKGMKLAGEAKMQGELGYEQAVQEKGAGFPDYMKAK